MRDIYTYFKNTDTEGIHYWRTKQNKDCKKVPPPTPLIDYTNYNPHEAKTTNNSDISDIQGDASYGGDTTHRK